MIEMSGRPSRLPQLAGIVDRLWYVEDVGCNGWELKLPTTTAQLIINLDADRLSTRRPGRGADSLLTSGPVGLTAIAGSAEVLDRTEQRRTAGVVIRAEAVGAVAGQPAEALGDLVDLDVLIKNGTDRIIDAAAAGRTGSEVLDLLERELVRLLRDRPGPDADCRAAIGLLRSGRAVAEVADLLGTSQSTLSRRFRRAVGMTAKHYQRLLRLECIVGLAASDPSPDWAEIAVRSGCYDQSHLVHEFSELTGLTPAHWRQARAGGFHLRLDDDFLQDRHTAGDHDADHDRPELSQSHAVSALSGR